MGDSRICVLTSATYPASKAYAEALAITRGMAYFPIDKALHLSLSRYDMFLLADEPDLEIVGNVVHPIDALLELGSAQPEVVVIDLPTSGEDPGLCSHLLAECPEVKVVAVSSGGETSIVYETGVTRRYLSDASPESVTQFIYSLTKPRI